MSSWHKVSVFREEGADTLKCAYRRTQISKMDKNANRSWNYKITQIKQEVGEGEEVLEV